MRRDILRVGLLLLMLLMLGMEGSVVAAAPEASGAGEASPDKQTAKIDVNTAGRAELQTISGIGPALADRIIAFRKENGPFERIEQLLAVKGIGPKLLTRMRERVVVRAPDADGS